MMKKIVVLLFLLGLTTSALADQSQEDAIQRGALFKISHNLNALSADPGNGSSIAIGQSLDILTGDSFGVCWEPTAIDE